MENLDGRFLPCGPLGLGKLEVRGVRPLARVGCRRDGHFSQTQRGSMCTYIMIHALRVMVNSKLRDFNPLLISKETPWRSSTTNTIIITYMTGEISMSAKHAVPCKE